MLIKDRIKKISEVWVSIKDVAVANGITFYRMNQLVLAHDVEVKTKNKKEYIRKKDIKKIDFKTKRRLKKVIADKAKELKTLKIETILEFDVEVRKNITAVIMREGLLLMLIQHGVDVNLNSQRNSLRKKVNSILGIAIE